MRMAMHKRANGIVILALLLSVIFQTAAGRAEAAEISEAQAADDGFLYRCEILMREEGDYQSVQLNREIYIQMSADAKDLRVLDPDGVSAPYFLYGSEQEKQMENVAFQAEYTGCFVKDGSLNMDFEIPKSPQKDVYGNCIQIMTKGEGFAKEMTFWGSHDGRDWLAVATELIYRVDGNEKMNVTLHEIVKFPFFRVTIPDNNENITIDSLSLVYTTETALQTDFIDSFQPDFTITEEDRQTVIGIPAEVFKNLRINRISIFAEDQFKRRVSTPLGEDVLYHLEFQEQTLLRNFVEGNGRVYHGQEDFQIIIDNGDDAPLRVDGITVEYTCDRVVFRRERTGPYTLAYGNPMLEKPVYDVASYAGFILREGVEEASLGEIRYVGQGDGTTGKKIDDTVWLHIVVGVASLVLILLIVKSVVRKGGEKG